MDFRGGTVVEVPPPPATLVGQPLRLRVLHRPEVQVGQRVEAGAMLSRPGERGRPCHVSPVAGTIERIDELPADHDDCYEVTIAPSTAAVPTMINKAVPRTTRLEPWIDTMRLLGPWGMDDGRGGLIAQLEASLLTRPDTVICLGLDRFPPYPDRSSVLRSFASEAAAGTRLVGDLVGARHRTMLVDRAMKLTPHLKRACSRERVKLVNTTNLVPSGEPTIAVWRYAKGTRRLPARVNPLEQRVLILTPWEAVRLGRWQSSGRVDIARPVLIGWPEQDVPMGVSFAMPGQSVTSLHVRLASATARSGQLVLHGDPLTGRATPVGEGADPTVADDAILLTILDIADDPVPPSPCISCGWCVDVCPTGLMPASLLTLCQRLPRPTDDTFDHLNWCIECGLCSHVCPSAIPLTQTFSRTIRQWRHKITEGQESG